MNSLTPFDNKIPAKRDNHSLHCPLCKVELFIVYHEDVEVDTCPHCNGVWIDPMKESFVLSKRPAGLSIEELQRLRKLYQPLGKLEPVRYLPCPVCAEMMHRKNWGSYSGVMVDICPQHGTWYDDKEIDKIKEYVRLGGMEYEKLKKSEEAVIHLNQKLNYEVERLENKVLIARLMNFFFGI